MSSASSVSAANRSKNLIVRQPLMSRTQHVNRDADEIQHHRRHVKHVVRPVAPSGDEAVKIAEDFFRPEVDAALAGITMGECDDCECSCGQKKRSSEMIQSQTVTPPLAAIDGTTFRLKTATTKSNTRSRRPRARISCGCSTDWDDVDNIPRELPGFARWTAEGGCPHMNQDRGGRTQSAPARTSAQPPPGLRFCVSAAPSLTRMRYRRTPPGACRYRRRCAAPKSSIARPTNTAGPSLRG